MDRLSSGGFVGQEAVWQGHLEAGPAAVSMLCYASLPIPGLEQSQLRSLLKRAQRANAEAGISGCLFFDGQQFIQVLEGEEPAVTVLFERIQRDPRHERIRLLFRGPAHRREFGGQPMLCYNLAWRRLRGHKEPQAALDGLLAARDVGLTDIVALGRTFACLGLPSWPDAEVL